MKTKLLELLKAHWPILVALLAGVALGYFLRPQPTIHEKVETSAVVAQAVRKDEAKVADAKLEQHRVAAPTVVVRTRYLPAKCGEQQQLAETIETRTGPVTVDTRRAETDATTSRTDATSIAQQSSKVELTIAPAAKSYSLFVGGQVRPEMHVAVGGAVRLGPIWLEGVILPRVSAPLTSEVIVGVRHDF